MELKLLKGMEKSNYFSKTNKLFYVIFIFLMIQYKIIAQTTNNNVNVREPKVFDMLQKYDVPMSNYTGTFDYNIPIYELNQNGFQDNISISYNSSGFYPNKRDGELGVNWSLNCGGVISRSVVGVPDEYMGYPTISGGSANGSYYGGRRLPASTNQTALDNGIFNLDLNYIFPVLKEFGGRVKVPGTTISQSYETKSDKFTFNFHGISGKFYINTKGQPIVICNNNIKIDVDLTYFVESPSAYPYYYEPAADFDANGTIYRSKIIFRLDNGYTYEFGGEINSLSYNMISPTNSSLSTVVPMGVNSWYLKKVTSPNGERLIYDYDHYKIDVEGTFASDPISGADAFEPPLFNPTEYPTYPFLVNRFKNKTINFDQFYSSGTAFGIFPLWNSATSTSGNTQDQVNYMKGCYIRSIRSYSPYNSQSNVNIYFYYTANTIKFYPAFNDFANRFGKKLSQIKVYTSNNSLIKNFDLNYTNYTNRNFLTSINLNSELYNQFDYYNVTSLPATNTSAIDHWGFFNDNSSSNILPFGDQDANGNYNITSSERDPSTSKYDYGMLKKVIFKTKGFTEFIYENHNYSKRLERRSVNNFLPALYSVNGIAGGARIKQIKQFDGTNYSNIKEYSYNDGSLSSGILLDYPRYLYYVRHDAPNGYQYFTQFNSSGFNSNAVESNYITYAKVTETNSDSSKIERYFSNYETNPDLNDINIRELQANQLWDPPINPIFAFHPTFNLPELYKNYIGITYNDQSIERGKLKKESFFSNIGTLVEEAEYKYNIGTDKFLNFIPNLKSTGGRWIQSYKIYTYANSLTEKKVKKYFQGNIVESTENNIYSDAKQTKLTSQTFVNSLGETIETKKFYPPDIEMVAEPNRSNLIAKNIIGIPLNIQSFKNSIKQSEQKIQYGTFVSDNPSIPLLLPQFELSKKGNDIDMPIIENKKTFNNYDVKGNITQYTQENGIPVSIIWGYNKTQPIAKIENIAYSIIPIALINAVQTLTDSSTSTEAQILIALNNIRSNAALANSMVTTYSYKPLIGVSTITDPKGKTIYYNYDNFGRLQNIKDQSGNILSENVYNFKP
jgi:YD repeat-containing protein